MYLIYYSAAISMQSAQRQTAPVASATFFKGIAMPQMRHTFPCWRVLPCPATRGMPGMTLANFARLLDRERESTRACVTTTSVN